METIGIVGIIYRPMFIRVWGSGLTSLHSGAFARPWVPWFHFKAPNATKHTLRRAFDKQQSASSLRVIAQDILGTFCRRITCHCQTEGGLCHSS